MYYMSCGETWIPSIKGFNNTTHKEKIYVLFSEDGGILNPEIIVTNPDDIDLKQVRQCYGRFPVKFVWRTLNVGLDTDMDSKTSDNDTDLYY